MNNDQRRLIDMYVNQYNQANAQIVRLYGVLDDIRYNINRIVHQTQQQQQQQQPQQPQQQQQQQQQQQPQQHRNQQSRTQQPRTQQPRNREQVLYDWQSPINPSLYITRPSTRMRNNNNNNDNLSDLLSSFLNTTVSVRPSALQIETASRLVRYGDITNPLSESCPISMDNFSIDDQVRQIRHCGHIFMPSEFDEWFQSNVRCPVCRYDIRNYTASSSVSSSVSSSTIDASNNEISYDISNNEIGDRIITSLTRRMIDSIFNPLSNLNSNDHFVFDPSNNVLMYETIIPNPNSLNQNSNQNQNPN
jgi:hypothetical protein